jgi:hypothetical protein
MYYDIIIIGSGMSGLYTAYNIKKKSKNISFLILEKLSKAYKGGRTNNEQFYGTKINTGAGIGRLDSNPLLIKLMNELKITFNQYKSIIDYSNTFKPANIMKIINSLKIQYKKKLDVNTLTFKEFFLNFYDNKTYKNFVISSGYSDYEQADVYETLFNYGFDDTVGGWTGLSIPWKLLVEALYNNIGHNNFKFNQDVIKINKIKDNPILFEITTESGNKYTCNKVIVATTINGIKHLIPAAKIKNSIYQQIHGQPFLRTYGKFNKKSSNIIKNYVQHYTIVSGPLQKIIPINSVKGVYMIAYSDNKSAIYLKKYLENNDNNRKIYCKLIETSLGIPLNSLELLAIKTIYWTIGTHYYEPLTNQFKNRNDFLKIAQNPEKNMVVIGEAVSRYQGWVEGALESVETVIDQKIF